MTNVNRKVRIGKITSDSMDKSIVVMVEWRRRHPLYKKLVKQRTKFVAHDYNNSGRTGDVVRIVETRPLSKTKNWKLDEILERFEGFTPTQSKTEQIPN
tara:strand:- start:110 stop:406 length:297 start_codon:yes stop_codon:yes gene_type:complete